MKGVRVIDILAAGPELAGRQGEETASLPHVLLVVDQLAKTLGGGERIVLKLAALLPEYGYRASILTFFAHPESAALQSPPCSIYVLPLTSTYNLSALKGGFGLRRFLKQEKVEIVQTFFESSDIWAGFVTKTMSKAKLIWSRRDMGILRIGKHHLAYRLMASVPDAVFAVSDLVRRHAIEVDRINPSRVRTIYNGLDLGDWDMAPRPAKPQGDFLITTVGNIRRVKGHDVFIRAAATVVQQFPNASFSIAGEVLEQSYFGELQALVQELNLADCVSFVGGVKDLRRHLASADLFVLPSRSEGFSNAIVEAMAASLPIVATSVGGNPEAVSDGINGFLVRPDDPPALAGAILRVLSDPERAKAMGEVGRKLAGEKFTTGAMMKQVTGIYKTLLAGN
jgi:glycosyltransferase involved in cell wall biosynthesis